MIRQARAMIYLPLRLRTSDAVSLAMLSEVPVTACCVEWCENFGTKLPALFIQYIVVSYRHRRQMLQFSLHGRAQKYGTIPSSSAASCADLGDFRKKALWLCAETERSTPRSPPLLRRVALSARHTLQGSEYASNEEGTFLYAIAAQPV
jgi:hypothetical protein